MSAPEWDAGLEHHVLLVFIISHEAHVSYQEVHSFIIRLYTLTYMCVVAYIYISKLGDCRSIKKWKDKGDPINIIGIANVGDSK